MYDSAMNNPEANMNGMNGKIDGNGTSPVNAARIYPIDVTNASVSPFVAKREPGIHGKSNG